MTDDEKRWQADIDREIAEAADRRLNHGERKQLIEALAEAIANRGFSEKTPLDVRIQQLREIKQKKIEKRTKINDEIDNIETEIEVLRERRGNYESEAEKLEGRIEGIESSLRHDGMNIFEGSSSVEQIANEYPVTPEDVINRLKDRNPDVPPWAFSNPMEERFIEDWNGFEDESVASLPVEERERHPTRE